jgi:hypothetical protein
MISVRQVNETMNGDPGKLMGKVVRTPKGEGKVRAVYSGRERGTFHVDVMINRVRHSFLNADIDLA